MRSSCQCNYLFDPFLCCCKNLEIAAFPAFLSQSFNATSSDYRNNQIGMKSTSSAFICALDRPNRIKIHRLNCVESFGAAMLRFFRFRFSSCGKLPTGRQILPNGYVPCPHRPIPCQDQEEGQHPLLVMQQGVGSDEGIPVQGVHPLEERAVKSCGRRSIARRRRGGENAKYATSSPRKRWRRQFWNSLKTWR